MEKVAVVTDSVCCLPREILERYPIKIVPISFIIDGQVYRDGVDISPTEVYELLVATKRVPTTSSPAPGDFLEAFRDVKSWASGVLCITINAEISMMHDSAVQAKQVAATEIPGLAIDILDSRTAGGAQGFIAMVAGEAASTGRNLPEVLDAAKSIMPRIHMVAVLETLEYLARAGRIPKAAAWAGGMLKIKPILTFSQGEIKMLERARSKHKGVARLLEIMEERTGSSPVHVNIMHANVPSEAEALKEIIQDRFDCVELYVTDFAPTMGVQAGPGVVALAFYSEDKRNVG